MRDVEWNTTGQCARFFELMGTFVASVHQKYTYKTAQLAFTVNQVKMAVITNYTLVFKSNIKPFILPRYLLWENYYESARLSKVCAAPLPDSMLHCTVTILKCWRRFGAPNPSATSSPSTFGFHQRFQKLACRLAKSFWGAPILSLAFLSGVCFGANFLSLQTSWKDSVNVDPALSSVQHEYSVVITVFYVLYLLLVSSISDWKKFRLNPSVQEYLEFHLAIISARYCMIAL